MLTKRFDQAGGGGTKEKEFKELIDILWTIEIETTAFNDPDDEGPLRISLYKFFTVCKEELVTGVTNQPLISNEQSLLYFKVCPKLQIHGLVVNEKVPGVQWRRFSITKKGIDLLAYIDKRDLLIKELERKQEIQKKQKESSKEAVIEMK